MKYKNTRRAKKRRAITQQTAKSNCSIDIHTNIIDGFKDTFKPFTDLCADCKGEAIFFGIVILMTMVFCTAPAWFNVIF